MPLWINNFSIELANRNKKIGLTIDCGGVNANGPGRFRTKGDNSAEQVCYFNTPNNDQLFNVLVSEMINFDKSPADIYFQIDKVKSKTNSETFDANSLLLQDGSSNDFTAKKYEDGFRSRQDRFRDDRITRQKQQSVDHLDRNFFQEDNDTHKKSKKKKKN